MTLQVHGCAAVGCSEPCPISYLMCVRHWRMVPMQMKRDVWIAFRAHEKARRREDPALMEATVKALVTRQAAAIAAVHAKEQQKSARIERLQRSLGL